MSKLLWTNRMKPQLHRIGWNAGFLGPRPVDREDGTPGRPGRCQSLAVEGSEGDGATPAPEGAATGERRLVCGFLVGSCPLVRRKISIKSDSAVAEYEIENLYSRRERMD